MPPARAISQTTGRPDSQISVLSKSPEPVLQRPQSARHQNHVEIFPDQVDFRNIEVGREECITMIIRNNSTHVRKIRLSKPKTKYFTIRLSDDHAVLSPGISLKVYVHFFCTAKLDEPCNDSLIVSFGDSAAEKVYVPVNAFPQAAEIEFDTFINLGTAVISNQLVKFVTFTNHGILPGEFKIASGIEPVEGEGEKEKKKEEEAEYVPLQLSPTTAFLEPGQSQEVRVEFNPVDLGPFTHKGIVHITGSEQKPRTVPFEMSANVVEQSLELSMPGRSAGAIKDIFLGSIYFGQTRVVRATLGNNSPLPTTFAIAMAEAGLADKQEDDDDLESSLNETQVDPENAPKPNILCIPSEGRLEPFTEMEVEFVFQPQLPPHKDGGRTGFKCQQVEQTPIKFETIAKIECVESKSRLNVSLQGQGVEPHISLSQTGFHFGECDVHERKDCLFTLTNRSEDLPVSFKFSKIAQFTTNPVRGKLPPLQSMNILVSFIPRNLGKFRNMIKLILEHGIRSFELDVSGYANHTGSKQKLVGGTDKLPVDFKPKVKYMTGQEPTARKKEKRSGPLKHSLLHLDRLEGMTDDVFEARYALSKEQYLDRRRVEHEANAGVTAAYKAREKQKKKDAVREKVDPLDPVSLGLPFASGMNSPKPELPPAMEELFLQYSMAGYDGQARFKPHPKRTESSNLLGEKKVFKHKPTTQAERRDCDTVLSHQNLQLVHRGPKVVDFGKLFLDATGKKTFTVTNDLETYIIVNIDVTDDELKQSGPLSQMVPPGETAEFDMIFQSSVVQDFKKSVAYTINGHHNYTFIAQAEVVPTALEMSKEELFFSFGTDNMSFHVTETLMLTNPSNVVVDFWWTSGNDVFSVYPLKGRLEAFKTTKVEVSYVPKFSQKRFEAEIFLHVKNGPNKRVLCHASLAEASCQFKSKTLAFGAMCVGVPVNKTVHIKNTGKTKTVFKCGALPDGVSVQPTTARLEAGASLPLVVSLNPVEAMIYNQILTCEVRGRSEKSKPLKLEITGEAVIPDVEVVQDEIDFSGVTLGANGTHPVSIMNRSGVSVIMQIDLSSKPEFSLNYPKSFANNQQDDLPIIPLHLADNNLDGKEEDGTPEVPEKENAFQLTIKPESTLAFELVFKPTAVKQHAFELPLVMKGLSAYAGVRRVVAAAGLKPKVALSHATVDFGDKVILKPDRALKNPYLLRFEMKNEELTDLDWSLAFPDIITGIMEDETGRNQVEPADVTWRVEPTKGTLLPGQSCTVSIFFSPTQGMSFNLPLNLYLDGQEGGPPYLTVPVLGIGTPPMLTFDKKEIVMPTVPLGVESKASFQIHNRGYENLELKYTLPQSGDRLPLVVNFPMGSTLGVGRNTVPVELSFMSKKPLGFNAKIEFADTDGNRFGLPIFGCTDNSVITLQPFLNGMKNAYELKQKAGTSIQLVRRSKNWKQEQEQRELAESASQKSLRGQSLEPDGDGESKAGWMTPVNLRKSLPDFTNSSSENLENRSCKAIFSFLNSSVLLPTHDIETEVANFPADILRTGGRIIFDMVKSLTGKNPVAVPGQQNQQKKVLDPKMGKNKLLAEQAFELYETNERFLTFLKAQGALVNDVKAQYLMSVSSYLRLRTCEQYHEPGFEPKKNAKEALAEKKALEKSFPAKVKAAWLKCMSQILKSFVINRITPKMMKSLPGVQVDQLGLETATAHSNFYGTPEILLLRWMEYHYNKLNPLRPRKLVNFDTNLADSLVFASLFQVHCPTAVSMQQMVQEPVQPEQREQNAKKILDTMKEIGMSYDISTTEICSPVAADLMLFCVFLQQRLPNFIPKTTVHFKGRLDEEMVKHIELANPSSKVINYTVALNGSADFSIDAHAVKLQPRGRPGSKEKFAIRFKPRFSKSVDARLVFSSDRDGSANANTLVFLLKSEVLSRKAIMKHEIESNCYEVAERSIKITNVFPHDCQFAVTLTTTQSPVPLKNVKKKKKAKKGPGGSFAPAPAHSGAEAEGATNNANNDVKSATDDVVLPPPFFCKHDKIKIKSGESVMLPINFLPFRTGEYGAQIVFIDEGAGEFMHELVGLANPPPVTEVLKWQAPDKAATVKEVPIGYHNPFFIKARQFAMEQAGSSGRKKDKKAKSSQPEWLQRLQKPDFFPSVNNYTVMCSSPFFSLPNNLTITEPKGRSSSQAKRAASRGFNKDKKPETSDATLNVQFQPKGAGVYKAEIILQSAIDLRVFYVEANVSAHMESPTLEIETPARKKVTQNIPIINSTEEAWSLKSLISGMSFSGPSDLAVPAKATVEYPISFDPDWVCEVSGKLELTNTKTTEKYTYSLLGVGTEPLAEENVVINCQARQIVEQVLPVKNYKNDECLFIVESDLPNISGDPNVLVEANSTGEYVLRLNPQLGGTFNGSVTFMGPDNTFTWVAVEVNAEPPLPESCLDIQTFVRKAAAVQISVTNPLNEELSFEIILQGDGLLGEPLMKLAPQETAMYEFVFSPLVAGAQKGSVSFINEKAGEFWYELNLQAESPQPVELPDMKCEVGSRSTQTILIENPTSEEIVLSSKSDNPRNYITKPTILSIKPFETIQVSITYIPSLLGEWQHGQLSFSHPSVGEWVYQARGIGEKPGAMPSVSIHTPVGKRLSTNLAFRNPFAQQITCKVALETAHDGVFKLFMKKPFVVVPPMETVQIPFTFHPSLIFNHDATIIITTKDIEDTLTWRFPIVGIAEGAAAGETQEIFTQARSRVDKIISLTLDGLVQGPLPMPEEFSHSIECADEYKNFLHHALSVQIINSTISNGADPIKLQVAFEPLRPATVDAVLVIEKKSGGRWRFPLRVISGEPEVDDIIKIEAAINTTASVSFAITNQFENFAKFQAFFTPESAMEFKVFPKRGVLEPLGSVEGTNFLVSFSPVEYGKPVMGLLVIQTDDMQWSYEVRGTHPRYVPPSGHHHIDNRISADVRRQARQMKQMTTSTNFLSRNVKLVKEGDVGSMIHRSHRHTGSKSKSDKARQASPSTLSPIVGGSSSGRRRPNDKVTRHPGHIAQNKNDYF
mmetsp:Transcript_18627/g.36432  ORF Transcript_18627/g.36432 Transcript_18627/m.36432 type:complete len:3020 (+) Transcript_18627:106-9165(+)|eukprot:CAMPEP_0175131532 /NCGR_PEP_ID=MMETSP0087-20121206/6593_1 /TAXON_ID=136419 /ORGANISM="Unknown Unknown, Strain D1" /LENGTH=3019 /DNA_ID=CAMNT_0016413829 /DNA_START=104 /DNA_END=9163 /DNA_ORIENTATION=+